jgi:hypothetical protein
MDALANSAMTLLTTRAKSYQEKYLRSENFSDKFRKFNIYNLFLTSCLVLLAGKISAEFLKRTQFIKSVEFSKV